MHNSEQMEKKEEERKEGKEEERKVDVGEDM